MKMTTKVVGMVLGFVFVLQGCQTYQGSMSRFDGPLPKIALVLGGGAARGFAHVGVIRVLEQDSTTTTHNNSKQPTNQ